jgi:hypothetical protein
VAKKNTSHVVTAGFEEWQDTNGEAKRTVG